MKKILSLLLCLCLLFSAAALAEDTAAAELQDTDVLATVNGTELTWADVEPVYDSLVSSYGNYYDLTDSANVELFRAVAMQNKINEVIMQAKIAELGIEPSEQVMFICHADCEVEARAVAEEMKARYGVKEVYINYIGPVIGSHTGPNTMGLFFVGTQR